VEDPTGLAFGLRGDAGAAVRSHAAAGHDDRVTVLVDVVRGLTEMLLSLVRHLAQVMR
jgi:hypothetical protein